MIGGGIFAVLGLSLQLSDGAAPLAFALAGLIALLSSYSYAKLSSRYPSEGGTIEFLVQAYGDGLLSGGLNIMLLASYIVMIALYAHAFASYGASLVQSYYHLAYIALAIFVVSSLTIVNMLGAKTSGRVELALVSFKLGVLLFVSMVALGLVDWQRLSPSHYPPVTSIIAGGMIIFLAYEGFELVANAAMDVENTSVLRRALYSSVVVVILVYILIAIVAAGGLSPQEVQQARDYALAILVKPVLGMAGFALVVAAALASTGSAINATLYGTARMSYMVAKYGQAPRVLGKKVWRNAYEGLIIISILSLALALGASLEAISAAGSGGFMIIFSMVNLAAYRLRRQTGANPTITLTGTILAVAALTILILRMLQTAPDQLIVFAVLLIGSFALEYAYRRITGRRLPRYIDPRLEEREKLLHEYDRLLPRIAKIIKSLAKDAEVYLIGSHARGEYWKANDIDILVATDKELPRHRREVLQKLIETELKLPRHHPIHLHYTTKDAKQEYLKKGHKKITS